FSKREHNNKFQLQDIWFYVTAIDASNNSYEPALDQSKDITVTDKVPPTITYTIENSTQYDGEITVVAYATDVFSFSNFVNNTFYINMSSGSISIETAMDYNPIYRNWFKIYSFPHGEEVEITIGVHDEAGNLGKTNFTIIVNDLAPPNIKRHEPKVYQNGTVTIWAEVVEGPFGSGLAEDHSPVTIEIIYRYSRIETMEWNGSGNFYAFSMQGFTPGEAFTYQIRAKDKNENVNITDWKPVSILDLTPPVYKAFSYSEQFVNHTATELSFWIEAYDPFGTIGGVNITVDYFDGYQWFNWIDDMIYNGTHYIYSIQLTCNKTFSYSVRIYDKAININETPILSYKTLNFQPTTAIGHGVEFELLELNLGEVRFWIKINDTFEEHTFQDHDVKLSVIDETLGKEILKGEMMKSNGSHHIYDLSIDFLHNFSYIMQINDDGVLGGYYEPKEYSNSSQMLDYWKPIILSSGIYQINESTIIIWANVSDWGSGVTEVLLKYKFEPYEGNGGAGAQFTNKTMIFNGSLYVVELTFYETGTLHWFIEAYDNTSFVSLSSVDYRIIFPTRGPDISGPTLVQTILTILITAVIIIVILYVAVSFQRHRNVKYQKIQDLENKLSVIPNIYTILICTEVGVPIYTLTNVLYQTNRSLNDALSGLSVGIDSFLQSFQTDFMEQVQQHDFEYHVETRLDERIRISLIEQNQFQTMIGASPNYRIFMFLQEKPSFYTREALYKVIKDLEEYISIPNLGIVDESIYGPQTKTILNKYLPITLLQPFIIDTVKLNKFDEELKQGRRPVLISKAGINALKRLVVIQTMPTMKAKNVNEEIKLFDRAMQEGLLKETRKLLFNDAMNIMKNLLKIPSSQIYDALWIGSSPNVEIIVPLRD
ncbi:MAG: hypothetical protein ACFFDT_22145, partial [Candidatus Hodarchaeota archaeon]